MAIISKRVPDPSLYGGGRYGYFVVKQIEFYVQFFRLLCVEMTAGSNHLMMTPIKKMEATLTALLHVNEPLKGSSLMHSSDYEDRSV